MEEVDGRESAHPISQIKSLTPEIWETILHFLYTHELSFEISENRELDHHLDLLLCAQECGIEELQKYFNLKFTENMDLLNITLLCKLAREKNLTVLESKAREIICLNAETAFWILLDLLKLLDRDTLISILQQDILSLEEDQVAEVISKWLNLQPELSRTSNLIHEVFGILDSSDALEKAQRFSVLCLPLFDRSELHTTWKDKKLFNTQLFSKEDITDACNKEIREATKKRIISYEAFNDHSPELDQRTLKEKILAVLANTPNYQIVAESFKISLDVDEMGDIWFQSLVDPDSVKDLSQLGPTSFLLRFDLSSVKGEIQGLFYPFQLLNGSFKQLLLQCPWPVSDDLLDDEIPIAQKYNIALSVFPYTTSIQL